YRASRPTLHAFTTRPPMSDRDPLQSAWANQTQEPFTMSIAEIHARAERFQSHIRFRNLTEYVAAGLVIAVFAWIAWVLPEPLVRAGALLIVAGAAYVCWKLNSLARAAQRAALDAALDLRAFHRLELMRQRAALAGVWRWYLAPLPPGMILLLGGVAVAAANPAPRAPRAIVVPRALA